MMQSFRESSTIDNASSVSPMGPEESPSGEAVSFLSYDLDSPLAAASFGASSDTVASVVSAAPLEAPSIWESLGESFTTVASEVGTKLAATGAAGWVLSTATDSMAFGLGTALVVGAALVRHYWKA